MALFISSTDYSFLIHWVGRKCNEAFSFQKIALLQGSCRTSLPLFTPAGDAVLDRGT